MRIRAQLFNSVLAALFAGLITLTTAYFVHIPTGIGYLHFGDAFIFLAACFLPRPYAVAAAALGGGLADLLTYPMWTLPTMLIKALCALPFSYKEDKLLSKRTVWSLLAAAVISVVGYGVAGAVMAGGNFSVAVAELPGSLIQAVGSTVLFAVIALPMDKLNLKCRFRNLRFPE